jgi:hypothetical protein
MAQNMFLALTLALGGIVSAGARTPVTISLTEPMNVTRVPPVTIGPGTYVVRTLDSTGRVKIVQLLSKRQDYVYTTVLAIPATRPRPDDQRQFVFSETPSGGLAALHFWFPPGESSGFEFVNSGGSPISESGAALGSLKVRTGSPPKGTELAQNAADFYALREVLQRIEIGKFAAARDAFKRNYFLAQNREGALTSFLLALLMTDIEEAKRSFELVSRLDPARTRVMSNLDVNAVVQSLPTARRNLKGSLVRRFLLNFAMEMSDDTVARTAILAFERHALKGDSFPVEIALDRRREELARMRRQEEQWTLAKEQIARLNDCVKSLLNKVGALEYSASLEARVGLFGSVKFRIVLNRRRLEDLDSIMKLSHKTICGRRSTLERLIAERNTAVARELDSLRLALRELDRQPGSGTSSLYLNIRKWEAAPAAGVSRDLMMLAEAANSPLMRPSSSFREDRAYVQMNIAGSLARLAEWVAP